MGTTIKILKGSRKDNLKSEDIDDSFKMAIEMVDRILSTFGGEERISALLTGIANEFIHMIKAKDVSKEDKEGLIKGFFDGLNAPLGFAWKKEFDENIILRVDVEKK